MISLQVRLVLAMSLVVGGSGGVYFLPLKGVQYAKQGLSLR